MNTSILIQWTHRGLLASSLLLLSGCFADTQGNDAIPSPSASVSASASPPASGTPQATQPTEPPSSSGNPSAEESGKETAIPSPVTTEAVLLATGDIMVHSPQLPAYYDAAADSYDFTPWFRKVKPLLSQGDWVIGNLETPVAGADLKFSGYPRFNAPTELTKALVDAGFGIVSTANNHSLDRGFTGIQRTLNNVRDAGLIPVGTSVSNYDSLRRVIVDKNGIKLGFLSYTYGTNGIPIPEGKEYGINLISLPKIQEDIRELKEAGADSIVVSLHFGIEYQRMPNDEQKALARSVIEAGADIILGSHPHVIQPYETIEVDDPEADSGKRRGFVIYSLGNFISNQKDEWKDVGVILHLKLSKTVWPDGHSSTTWSDVETTPTWVNQRVANGLKRYTVLPLPQTLADAAGKEWTSAEYGKMRTYLNGISLHLKRLSSQSAG
ncbi:CapA family protein [Cohnella sp. AR92]|uniref:CapA family protein n=1 Tax=Cohnella sp. AR92 TaxID=648716 RepID=UPI0013156D68|nr:CapA family protein [Cohnella sp. AR92]